MTLDLGRFTAVSVKKKWNSEPYDFTPWLANEGLDLLGKELNLELELETQEVNVGVYRADIVATDSNSNRVVIENQLNKSDHDHLGKCLTYASVLEAKTIIWIAGEFSEEHKKAIDWLNDNSSEEIRFYGVAIELWQIDNSKPAVRFNVVCRPNECVKESRRVLVGIHALQYNFWNDFCFAMKNAGYQYNLKPTTGKSIYSVFIGKKYAHIQNRVNFTTNKVSVNIYIPNRYAEQTFNYLLKNKSVIEKTVGNKFEWTQNTNHSDKVIRLENDNFNINLDNGRIEAVNWFAEKTISLRKVLNQLLNSFSIPEEESEE